MVASAIFFTIGLAASSITILGFNHIIIQASISTLNMILGVSVISTALSVVSFFLSFIGRGESDQRSSAQKNETKSQSSSLAPSSPAISKNIVGKKADVDEEDKYGETALMLAAKNGHTETVKALKEMGADLEKQDKYGETALMLAAKNGLTETIDILKIAQAQKKKKQLQSTCYKLALPIITGVGAFLLYNSRKMTY